MGEGGRQPASLRADRAEGEEDEGRTDVDLGLAHALGRELVLAVHGELERALLHEPEQLGRVGLELVARVHVLVQDGAADCGRGSSGCQYTFWREGEGEETHS